MAEELDDRSKDLLVDVIVLALARCAQGGVGLAFRNKLRNDKRVFAPEDGSIDLRPAWTLLAAMTGVDLQSTKPAFIYVKGLSERLGVPIVIPDHIDPDPEAAPLLTREEVDRFFVAAATKAVTPPSARSLPCLTRRPTAVPTSARSSPPVSAGASSPPREPTPRETTTTAAPPKERSKPKAKLPPAPATPLKIALAIGSLVVAAASVWFIARPAIQDAKLEWRTLPPAEVSSDIPIARARVAGREVHVELSDPAWLQSAEIQRTQQLKTALELLQYKDINTLIVEEGTKVRATAQWAGNPPKPRIRYY